jgi:glutathione synthase/RimK-type ligase-like ATP-grasp enzyme
MKRCVFLSMDSLEQFECYDHLLLEPMAKAGWQAEEISWRKKNVNWSDYDVVIIRSTWDYQDDPEKFIQTLENISAQTRLENSLEIVHWNINKTYLIDLDISGIKVVSTLWGENLTKGNLLPAYQRLNVNEIIIKPVISANADFTYRLNKESIKAREDELIKIFKNKSYMIQPFMSHILSEGEYSLFYFGGKYSHCILKKPREKDFRVQEEHGGILTSFDPDPHIRAMGEKAIAAIGQDLLYARVDFVRSGANDFALMELELIEPSLYFNMDTKSAQRFVDAFVKRIQPA